MNRFLLPLFTLLLGLLLFACVPNIAGQWQSQDQQVQLNLGYDSSYQFGASQGTYAVVGNLISFTDTQSGMTTDYTFNLIGNQLQLIDVNGNYVDLYRLMAPAPTQAVAASSANTQPGVLAQSGDYQLSQPMVDIWAILLGFLTDVPLKQAEYDLLTQQALDEFNANPHGFDQETRAAEQTLVQLSQLKDPSQVGMVRQAILFELYRGSAQTPQNEWPVFVQILWSHVGVLGFDEANGLILTNKDFDAFLAYQTFIYTLGTGQTITWTEADYNNYGAELMNQFPVMALEQKQFICSMGVFWDYFVAMWEQATPEQQQQMAAELLAQATPPQVAEENNWNTGVEELPATMPAQDYSNAGGGTGMNQATFDIMQDMMLNEHATTMNIINNIGDSGDYYYVDYNNPVY